MADEGIRQGVLREKCLHQLRLQQTNEGSIISNNRFFLIFDKKYLFKSNRQINHRIALRPENVRKYK